MTILAFVVLLPNLLLFSTDDLDTYRKSAEGGIAISQAGVGRYTFHLIGWLCRWSGLDYNSYVTLGVILFSSGLALLFGTVASIAGERPSGGWLVGYLLFLTFGLNLDLLQYVFAYSQYGVAFLCAAGALWLAHTVRSMLRAVISAASLGTIGLGAYQLYAQIVLLAVLALCLCSALRGEVLLPRRLRRLVATSLAALILGAVFYLAANGGLRWYGIAAFAHYPVREQGVAFVRANLPAYLATLSDLMAYAASPYQPLLPKIWRLVFAALALYGCAILGRAGWRHAAFGVLVFGAAVLLWPNPANLFLADYWPSARSMAGFSLFLGTVCCVLYRNAPARGSFGNLGRAAIVGLLACQSVLMVLRYQDRVVQQAVDTALAQAIVMRAESETPPGAPAAVDLAIAPDAVQTVKPVVYDYGRSLLAAPWSAPAFLDHLSGHRVAARVVDPGACAGRERRLSFEMRGDRLLVCLLAR